MNRLPLLASLVLLAANAVACSGSADPSETDPANGGQAVSAGSDKTKSHVIKLGVQVRGTFSSTSDVQTFTFVAQKGWKIDTLLRAEACGPQIPNTPACEAAFAPHLEISQGGKNIVDVTGDLQNGDAFGNITAPQDGTYTMKVSVAKQNGTSPLTYLISASPPDIACKSTANCQVQIDGKTIETGLTCVQSDFPDEDGTAKFCDILGEGNHAVK
jgi:hypothetical protein